MRYPLDGEIVVTGAFKEKAVAGTGLIDSSGIPRHIGVDLRALKPSKVYAPARGVVTASYVAVSGNQIVELLIEGNLWRFLHLSARHVKAGDTVAEGQIIAMSGNTGGVPYHLHIDVRKNGSSYTSSLNNFIDPMQFFKEGPMVDKHYLNMLWVAFYNVPANDNDYSKWVGKPYAVVLDHLVNDGNRKNYLADIAKNQEKAALYDKQAAIDASTVAKASKWDQLQALLK